MDMQLQTVDIHNPEGLNFIFGQSVSRTLLLMRRAHCPNQDLAN